MLLRHYENELRYLREAGAAFAEAHPEQARLLAVDSLEDRDPYVERLFEGFAFLAGRIHERLEDDLPEYTQRLVRLLYPQFLRPVPSLCVVELRARPGRVMAPTALARGTEVRSEAAGPERTECRFRTTQDVVVQPLDLAGVELEYAPDETSRARLAFRLHRGVALDTLDLARLRLYVHADGPAASTAHLLLTRHAVRVEARAHDPTASTPAGAPPAWSRSAREAIRPGGFGDDEALLPHGPETPAGLRLLQEYLLFRRKFWQVELLGLDALARSSPKATAFEVTVHFDRPYPEQHRLRAEHVRLHCTPAVNLFEHDAEPVRMDHTADVVRVVPSLRQPRSVAAYEVLEVVGLEEATGRRHAYAPALSLQAAGPLAGASGDGAPPRGAAPRTFDPLWRAGPAGSPEVVLALSSPEAEGGDPPAETLSIHLLATNGALPHEALGEKGLPLLDPALPQVAEPANLGRPTNIHYPPLDRHGDLLWALLAHWSFGRGSVATREALAGLLELYDWEGGEANRRRRRGLRDVRWAPKEALVGRAVRSGAEVTVEVEDGHFADEGDLCLFGLVLSEFLSLYATINQFVHLTIVTSPSGRRYAWAPERGARPPV